MKSIFILFSILSVHVFATPITYQLDIELARKAVKLASPQMFVRDGQTATMTEESQGVSTFIEVTPHQKTMNEKKAVLLKFTIGNILPKGERRVLSTPQILAYEGLRAEMLTADENGIENLTLSVYATAKNK